MPEETAEDAPPENGGEDASEDLSQPPAPLKNLSPKAIEQRLRRVCKPDKMGNFKVPEQVVKEFEDVSGGGRASLLRKFEQCGFERAGRHLLLMFLVPC